MSKHSPKPPGKQLSLAKLIRKLFRCSQAGLCGGAVQPCDAGAGAAGRGWGGVSRTWRCSTAGSSPGPTGSAVLGGTIKTSIFGNCPNIESNSVNQLFTVGKDHITIAR